jgi:4a-hydroxytetrahydrobiopterin dehydratase
MTPLSPDQIHHRLPSLLHWHLIDNQLTRTFVFPNFLAAINFVDKLALLAEAANHHPDIDIRYNKITLRLTSHDAGGITTKDFTLAEQISTLVP